MNEPDTASRRRRGYLRAAALLALSASACALAMLVSCQRTESYVYTAQRFDPDNACVESYAPIEVVNGPGTPGTCEAYCLMVGTDIYVTQQCPPLPANATDLALDSEECVAARTAMNTQASCDDVGEEEDAGEEEEDASEEPEQDAEPEMDAGEDAEEEMDSGPQDAGDAG